MLQRVRHILGGMCVILPLAALALILQGQHAGSAASTQLFVSKLPTPTPAATATPAVPGLFISPLSTPAGMTIQARLPLVHLQPTPPPIKYGWKGVGHTSEGAALGASNDPTNKFWGIDPDWWYDWHHSGVTLTVPTADVDYGQRAIPLWNNFLTALANRSTPVPIHGIAIHAYPNNGSTFHLGPWPYRCNGVDGQNPQMFLDPDCVKRALESAYNYFEGVSGYGNPQPQLTQNRPIWLTETGVLTGHAQLDWDDVQTGYQTPLMNWLLPRMLPTAQPCCAWINAVAWYSTHRSDGADHTASNLLVPTPVAPPALGTLTPLGAVWRDMSCLSCACPGYNCQ